MVTQEKVQADLRIRDRDDILDFEIYFTESGAVRVLVDEKEGRWKPPFVLVQQGVETRKTLRLQSRNAAQIKVESIEAGSNLEVVVDINPVKVVVYKNKEPVVLINSL